jgi:hypothetical protein
MAKKVALRWESCLECPFYRFDLETESAYCTQNQHLHLDEENGTIPDDCPIEDE